MAGTRLGHFAVVAVLAWAGIGGVAEAADFTTSSEGVQGGLPTDTAVGDFNRDGTPDLATSSANNDNVTILLGDGAGGFDFAATSPEAVSDIPNSITAADFNRDGKLDLATVSAGTLAGGDVVRVLLGDGTGDFTTVAGGEPVGGTPLDIVSGDFNGDGKPDLATADKDAGTVTILIGAGTGDFTPAATSPEPVGARPYGMTTGDFNGDGKVDLATANESNTTNSVSILLGSGTGNFTAPGTSPEIVTDRPIALAAADFNRDGKQDLATANPNANSVTVLTGAGNGNFTPGTPIAGVDSAIDLTAADFDGDGVKDLAVANSLFDSANSVPAPGTATILRGNGDGTFTEVSSSPEAASDGVRAIAGGDFDNDGKPDLVVTNYWGGNVTIMLNQTPDRTDANFTAPPSSPEAVGDGPQFAATGDFNGDGKEDLATANVNSDNVTVMLGDGSGNFTAAGTSPESAGDSPAAVATGDFNGDGRQDLATANTSSDNVTILLGDGSGNFTAAGTSPEAAGDGPRSVVSGDFNGDGREDLATANQLSDNVTILLGDGTGNFTATGTSPEAAGDGSYSVASGDFNGDGKEDLATANVNSDNVSILLGDGSGNFTAAGTSPEAAGDSSISVATGDFDGDGKEDLATANGTTDDVSILLGDGTGNFTAAGTSPEAAGDGPVSVAIGDFDGDGKEDLATANQLSDNVTILGGTGTGNFTAAGTSPEAAGDGPTSVATGDFDRDGKQDLATANFFSDNATILLADAVPTAVDNSTSVNEDSGATTINVLANDTDSDGGPKSIGSKTDGGDGTVAITNNGADLTYTPNANFCGSDSFTYTLTPGGSTATVNVTVTCSPDAPVAANDSRTLSEDAGATTIDVLANDTDADGDAIAIFSKTDGDDGAVAITNNGDDLTYTPDADFCGSDTFTYTVGGPGGSTATVNVTVTCVDDLPLAVDDSKTVAQDDPATTVDVRANDTDIDAGPKSIASNTNAAHGTVAITNGGADLTYSADADFCGPDSFTYTLNGGSTATVNVTVSCVNAAPRNVSAGTAYEISEGDPLTLGGDAFDRDGNSLSYAWDVDGDGAYDDATGPTPTLSPAELNSFGLADGPLTTDVRVRASDGTLQTTSAPAALTVRNAAPSLAITGSADGLSDKTFDFTMTATDPSPADQTGQFDFAIDDDADGSFEETANAPSTLEISREFGDRGSFSLAATATDKDSSTSPVTTVSLRLATLRKACKAEPVKLVFGSSLPDELKGTKRNDLISGAAGADEISSRAGADCVKAGKGSDEIEAGRGDDAAFGQVGNDTIDISGPGDGLAICGPGKDTAIVGPGDDTKGCEKVRRGSSK